MLNRRFCQSKQQIMIEFSNLIQIMPIGTDSFGHAKVYDFVAYSPFSYIPQLTYSEAGNCWNCDKTIVIDLPDSEARRFFSIECNATIKIKTTDGKFHQIGTADIPARVQISSNLTSANLIIKCKMLTDPFL